MYSFDKDVIEPLLRIAEADSEATRSNRVPTIVLYNPSIRLHSTDTTTSTELEVKAAKTRQTRFAGKS
ncbi:hypothetical protein N7457_000375 [Penicillium paradoxum]|uniref:uncharacterized protein n=1 Tax=Penicillium paradoxum TaxID=176176 RepID=UPI002549802E|nr:uncharacterized protein N7457_000375 [Penicillium paradoxum]KAJ5793776.1 hypothetical protein N7457_000375 [Penicillium paradoxum]